MNSKRKGKRGELELVDFLKGFGYNARRGQQFKGTPDSPDIVCYDLDAWQIECKRVEKGNLYDWLEQAIDDAGLSKMPVVMHKRNHKPWVAVLRLTDFLTLVRK